MCQTALMSLPKKWRTNMKYIFLTVAFTLATIASANADTTCAVNSPDGELNVRELTQNGPGKVIGVVKNGYTVTMRDFYFLRGQSWARVVDGKTKTKVKDQGRRLDVQGPSELQRPGNGTTDQT
jgi:hypothetical protein